VTCSFTASLRVTVKFMVPDASVSVAVASAMLSVGFVRVTVRVPMVSVPRIATSTSVSSSGVVSATAVSCAVTVEAIVPMPAGRVSGGDGEIV